MKLKERYALDRSLTEKEIKKDSLLSRRAKRLLRLPQIALVEQLIAAEKLNLLLVGKLQLLERKNMELRKKLEQKLE